MIHIDGNSLTLCEIERVLYDKEQVAVAEEAIKGILDARSLVERKLKEGKIVYGINTGFGKLSETTISNEHVRDLQVNLIRSHACGVGEPFSEPITRLMLLLRANALAKGYSGIRMELIQLLIDCLNHGVHPVIPSKGSLGASGDLAPLSHLALVLIGEGEAIYQGRRYPGMVALQKAGLKAIELEAKEGLALINGTQAMAASGVIAYIEGKRLADFADGIASLTLESLRGVLDPFLPMTHEVRPFKEQQDVAKRICAYVDGSGLMTRQGEVRIQDAYSLRCIPQVHGAIQQVLSYVEDKLTIEINAATDNPLIFPETDQVISGGNFHGQPLAFAMDFLGIAISELANISERRIERLVNPQLNDLPPFLSANPGLESGLMITQYVAASLVSENKVLAHPSSVDSIPSSANQEDHVSMGATAARHALSILENARKVLAIEWICAAQAADFRGMEKLAPKTRKLYDYVRKRVAYAASDRSFSFDIDKMANELKHCREPFL
ncbi:histidine ammonia-lyase [Pradoshia sp.]